MATSDKELEEKIGKIYGCEESPVKYIVKANGIVEYTKKKQTE